MRKAIAVRPENKKRGRGKFRKVKVSQRFVTALSIVSILGFIGIVSESLFAYDLGNYIEAFWMAIIGIGLIMEVDFNQLRGIASRGLNRENFADLITLIIGDVALIAGVFSFPVFRIDNPSFLAVKGIISIIGIVIIIIQTWIIDKGRNNGHT